MFLFFCACLTQWEIPLWITVIDKVQFNHESFSAYKKVKVQLVENSAKNQPIWKGKMFVLQSGCVWGEGVTKTAN